MMRFRATAVAAEEADECFIVILAEKEDGSGSRIEFQRSNVIDDEDVRLGMGTYCIATGHGPVHYGGIVAWELSGARLEVQLTSRAAEALELDEVFTVELPDCDLVALHAGLERVIEAR